MKIIFVLLLSITLFSCHKNKCGSKSDACGDTPPTDETCGASFGRWFYDPGSNQCFLQHYDGCKEHGYGTKDDCVAGCGCKD